MKIVTGLPNISPKNHISLGIYLIIMPIIKVSGFECLRCGHKWAPKKIVDEPTKPKICPKCKSPYWDLPRKRKTT